MFLRATIRKKDGKEHRYWSLVESKRVSGGLVVQRHVLYLGEINSSQELAWRKSIEVLEDGAERPRTLALFPEDRCEGVLPDASVVRLRLSQVRLRRPRRSRRQERAMRRRQLKWLWARLKQLSAMRLSREELLMKLGAARHKTPTAWRLVTIEVSATSALFSYRLDRTKLRVVRRREGRYLLRTNLVEEDPAKLWSHYLLLVAVEEAFKNLKGDLAIRPVFHQIEARVEAHVFIAFLAYCLHVTLARRLHALAPGLTPRSVLEKFAAVQMIDVHLPTTDGRELLFTRYTDPEPELRLLLNKLRLELPPQPPPKITAAALDSPPPM